MDDAKRSDFVGRHLIIDASTSNRRNLTSTDTVFTLLEALARNLDMTLVLPPIVFRYPFANSELASFCDDIEVELTAKAKDMAANNQPVDLSLGPVRSWSGTHSSAAVRAVAPMSGCLGVPSPRTWGVALFDMAGRFASRC